MSDGARAAPKETLAIQRERVAGDLRRLIAIGELGPGERVVEREISERYEISRGRVREAILQLQHEGLVEWTPYAGVCVARLESEQIDELVALRRQVEYFAIAGAASRASEEACDHLSSIAAEMRSSYENGDLTRCVELDMKFHLEICEASGHRTLVTVMQTLLPRLTLIWYPDLKARRLTPAMLERAHMLLVKAIRQRDVELAVQSIDDHIDTFYQTTDIGLDRSSRRGAERITDRLIVPVDQTRPYGGQ